MVEYDKNRAASVNNPDLARSSDPMSRLQLADLGSAVVADPKQSQAVSPEEEKLQKTKEEMRQAVEKFNSVHSAVYDKVAKMQEGTKYPAPKPYSIKAETMEQALLPGHPDRFEESLKVIQVETARAQKLLELIDGGPLKKDTENLIQSVEKTRAEISALAAQNPSRQAELEKLGVQLDKQIRTLKEQLDNPDLKHDYLTAYERHNSFAEAAGDSTCKTLNSVLAKKGGKVGGSGLIRLRGHGTGEEAQQVQFVVSREAETSDLRSPGYLEHQRQELSKIRQKAGLE